ncbi:MAG: AAA family ATPase [Erythrobacter sp.]|nr:MAG: AAA family ATPase [Erythrobacter sp.]
MVQRSIYEIWAEYYLDPLILFLEREKQPVNYFSYKGFKVSNFRGLSGVSLDFTKNDLVLLLGLNESGKTSILKAIEAFDFNNDPPPEKLKPFFTSMRNKQEVSSSAPCQISAEIEFAEPLNYQAFKQALKAAGFDATVKSEVDEFLRDLSLRKKVRISRVIPFSGGNPGKSFYQFEDENLSPIQRLSALLHKVSCLNAHSYCTLKIFKMQYRVEYTQKSKIPLTIIHGMRL